MSTKPIPVEGDYPKTVFFGVYRGHETGVRATHVQLMKAIENYKSPIWEAFDNKAHAEQFAKTGTVPSGASPVQRGAHNTSGGRRTVAHSGGSSASRFAVSTSRLGGGSGSGSALEGTRSMSALTSSTAPAPKLLPTNSVPVFSRSPTRAGRPSTAPTTEPKRSVSTISGTSRGHPVSATTSASFISSRNMSSTPSASTGETIINAGDEVIEVWTDGSCLDNGKPTARAAYAVYFGEGDPRNEAERVPGTQTNNRGEVLGVIRALEIVDENVPSLIVYTDSKYTIDSCEKWLPGWIQRGGLNSSRQPAANYSMIRYLAALMERRGDRLQLLHVKGHSTNAGNNAADLLANQAAANKFEIPSEVDWDAKRCALGRRPASPHSGRPVIATVPATAVASSSSGSQITKGSIARVLENAQTPAVVSDSEDEYNEFDDEYFLNIDESSLPQPVIPPSTAVTQPVQRKRGFGSTTDEEEIEDSETERKATKKTSNRRRAKCPKCAHEFPV